MAFLTPLQIFELARQHRQAGRLAEAEELYLRLLSLQPNNPDILHLLGLVAHQRGALDSAVQWIRRAIAVAPSVVSFHNNLGNALKDQGSLEEAVEAYRHAIRLGPDMAHPYINLGTALNEQGRRDEAIAAYKQALKLDPMAPQAYTNLGVTLQEFGRTEQALALYQQAANLPGHFPGLCDNYLATLHYTPGITLQQLRDAHAVYESRYARPLRSSWQPHTHSRDTARPLRLGFISPHFHYHPVGRFIVRLLENLDRSQFHAVCYSDGARPDAMTSRLQACATEWHDVSLLTDEELDRRIRADRIDILFDLAGHTPGNRLPVFARKPAPVQITWLDYVGTTGLSAIDYILADSRQIPMEAEAQYEEEVLRMPDDYICFDAPDDAPAVSPLPALANGFITFASFNIISKTSAPTIEVWSRVLHRVPGSKLLLKNRSFDLPEVQGDIRAMFAAHSIDPARIEFRGRSPHAELLATYCEADIALDTFPYNGGLTTCEALWMGLPVVSCAGETFASRHGLAHLTAAGLPELVATDFDQYEQIAVQLAGDLEGLARLRTGLRAQVAASALCDGPRFAAHFARLMKEAWHHWCNGPVEDGKSSFERSEHALDCGKNTM
jgi:predicted O-linked N-acetylglucosamine transferase (SPINDLY family)